MNREIHPSHYYHDDRRTKYWLFLRSNMVNHSMVKWHMVFAQYFKVCSTYWEMLSWTGLWALPIPLLKLQSKSNLHLSSFKFSNSLPPKCPSTSLSNVLFFQSYVKWITSIRLSLNATEVKYFLTPDTSIQTGLLLWDFTLLMVLAMSV